MRFFEWIAEVCRELSLPIEEGEKFVADENWFWCYDDGMTPGEAIAEAKAKGII